MLTEAVFASALNTKWESGLGVCFGTDHKKPQYTSFICDALIGSFKVTWSNDVKNVKINLNYYFLYESPRTYSSQTDTNLDTSTQLKLRYLFRCHIGIFLRIELPLITIELR